MKLAIYSVYDKAVNAYMQPFYCRTTGEAIRSFSDAVNDPNKQFGKYAADYVLMQLGEFDDGSGLFVTTEPVRIVGAHELLIGQQEIK